MHLSAHLFRTMPLKEGQQPNLRSTERGHCWMIMTGFHHWVGHQNGRCPILFFNGEKFGLQTSSYIHIFHTTN